MTKRRISFLIIGLLLGGLSGMSFADDASKDPAAADQTENNYYWQGTQLYNLGRLGEAFESFEKAIQRKQNSKEAEAYLLQIRQEIVKNAQNRAKERAALNYDSNNSPDSALNVTYVQKGYTKITLQAKYLFNENASAFKSGAIDVLNRVAELLDAKEGNRVELTLVDELDDNPGVRDIDAERSLIVFSYINFRKLHQAQAY